MYSPYGPFKLWSHVVWNGQSVIQKWHVLQTSYGQNCILFLPKFSLFTNKSALRRLHCERNRSRSEAKWPIERIDLLPYLILENWPHRYRLNEFQNESNPSQYPYQCWARWLLIVRHESAFVVVQRTLLPFLGWLWNVPTSLVGNVCTIARLIRPSTFLIFFL